MRSNMARLYTLLRLLMVMGLAAQTLVGPATPVAAQSAAPVVSFTCGTSTPGPCTLPVGGTIVVNGSRYPVDFCRSEQSVRVALINQITGGSIDLGVTFFDSCSADVGASFRFPSGSGTYMLPTSGPGAVPAGTYRVRGAVNGVVVFADSTAV